MGERHSEQLNFGGSSSGCPKKPSNINTLKKSSVLTFPQLTLETIWRNKNLLYYSNIKKIIHKKNCRPIATPEQLWGTTGFSSTGERISVSSTLSTSFHFFPATLLTRTLPKGPAGSVGTSWGWGWLRVHPGRSEGGMKVGPQIFSFKVSGRDHRGVLVRWWHP